MKSIPILLKINNILDISDKSDKLDISDKLDKLDKLEHIIETHGIMISIIKKKYIITLHQGLPIKEIIIKDRDKTYSFILSESNTFTICGWNDMIIIPFDNMIENLFVFKQFVKKQININTLCSVDLKNIIQEENRKSTRQQYQRKCKKVNIDYNNAIKFIENETFPINMMPNNPSNIYYKMNCKDINEYENIAGKPIYSSDKLIGIIAKVEDSFIYVIPSLYIVTMIEKTDNNTIYTLPDNLENSETCENIIKIGYYKIINNKIYYNKFNNMISLESYFLLEGDIDKLLHIIYNSLSISNSITKKIKYIPYINNMISNNNTLNILENKIHITSGFLHLMKICYNDREIIMKMFKYVYDKKYFEHIINNINYILSF